jgi:DnaJ-like protein
MSFDTIVEAIIKDALERGEFEDLPGKGKPIDLTAYFDTPEEVRLAHSILNNAGVAPREVDLLKEIAELKQILPALLDEKKKQEIQRQIEKKQVEFSLMLEQQRRPRKQK